MFLSLNQLRQSPATSSTSHMKMAFVLEFSFGVGGGGK